MKRTLLLLTLAIGMVACGESQNKNGLILIDPNTKKEYLLKKNAGDNYFIYEKQMVVSGKDTTYQFK